MHLIRTTTQFLSPPTFGLSSLWKRRYHIDLRRDGPLTLIVKISFKWLGIQLFWMEAQWQSCLKKIKRCRFALVDWSRLTFGLSKPQLQEKQKMLEELCLQNRAENLSSIKSLKAEITNIIHQDELFWRQRSNQFGYLLETRTQNIFTTVLANVEEKTISLECLIMMRGGALLMSKLPK